MTDLPLHAETAAGESPSSPTAPPSPAHKRRWVPWVAGGMVVLVFVGLVVGTVVWALSRKQSGTLDPAIQAAAFASAMKKASVDATSPTGPVDLTSLRVSGGHAFSATFTPEELAALLNTYSYTAEVSGSRISLSDVSLALAGEGSLRLSAGVGVDGAAYSGTVTVPVALADGLVTSTGATAASAEGFSLNESQRAQITDALLGYANAYLDAAPGLRIGSAKVTAGGIAVTGVAPDRIELP